MVDLYDFGRGMIIGARLAGASVTIMTSILGVGESAVSTVISTHLKQGKTSPKKNNSSWKSKLTETEEF